jgi:hypothetical protein
MQLQYYSLFLSKRVKEKPFSEKYFGKQKRNTWLATQGLYPGPAFNARLSKSHQPLGNGAERD